MGEVCGPKARGTSVSYAGVFTHLSPKKIFVMGGSWRLLRANIMVGLFLTTNSKAKANSNHDLTILTIDGATNKSHMECLCKLQNFEFNCKGFGYY